MERLGIVINRTSPLPLHRQLVSAFREAIVRGDIAPGERILSSRELQTHLGLSRNTVVNALEQLHAEGYLLTQRGVGTFVAQEIHKLPREPVRAGERIVPSASARRFVAACELAADLEKHTAFRPGLPALDEFPARLFRRGLSTAQWTPPLLDYGDALGHEPLRHAIARRLQQTRGIVASADRILITDGAQSALALVARVLLDPRDAAIVEDPGYPNFRALLLAQGARLIPIPVDNDGIVVAAFRRKRAKLVYVTPSHQYPTGVMLSLERRLQLLEWAITTDAWIVEDDYDSEFNYTERPLPALQGLGGGGRVIYVGTFSKVLAPGLRVAYIVVPEGLMPAFRAARQISSGVANTLIQSGLATFMENGHLGRHIARMRKLYDERRRFTSHALSKAAGGTFGVKDTRAGLHFIAELPPHISDVAFAERARLRGVIAPPLSRYFAGEPREGGNGIVIGFAATAPALAKAAIATLVQALDP